VLGWLGAMAASGLAALVVGVAALRLREDYLAITTFGIAVVIQLVALNAQALTGGPFGIQSIPKPLVGLLGTGFAWNLAYLGIVLLVLATAYMALERLVASPWGRVLRAIREDEAAAASLGKHARAFRLQAFVIGSMLMGLGGALYAHFVGYIAPEDFLPVLTFQVWAMLIVGGSGNNLGAILGAVIVWAIWSVSGGLIREILPASEQARGAALQVVLIGVLIAPSWCCARAACSASVAAVSRTPAEELGRTAARKPGLSSRRSIAWFMVDARRAGGCRSSEDRRHPAQAGCHRRCRPSRGRDRPRARSLRLVTTTEKSAVASRRTYWFASNWWMTTPSA
jgi:branched-chain amino acid transport system permease protein